MGQTATVNTGLARRLDTANRILRSRAHGGKWLLSALLTAALAMAMITLPEAPVSAASGSSSTKIWIGAPFSGYWAGSPMPQDSRPEYHNPVYSVPGHTYTGDWAMDYYGAKGTAVSVYVAPKDTALNNVVTTKVLAVRPACSSGVVANGGYVVQVGIYDRGTQVGVLSYAHVNPDFNRDGKTTSYDTGFRSALSRWGGYIGTVGAYTKNSCWQVSTTAGVHTHFEAANAKNYSCFRGSVANHASIAKGSYIGYLGGAFATAKKKPCPAGA